MNQGSPASDGDRLPADGREPAAAPPGALDELLGAFASAREAVARFLELLRLEARLAGRSLLWMLALVLFAALCFITTWLGVSTALVIAVMWAGYGVLVAVGIVTALNLVAAFGLIMVCVRLSRNLRFTATRRQLRASRSSEPEA